MKFLFTVLLSVFLLASNAQEVEIRAGRSLFPGTYVALRYMQPTNTAFEFSVKAFLDRSRKNGLHYTAYGIDVMAEIPYSFLRIGLGPTVQAESESWVYASLPFSQRINYGIAADVSGQLRLTDAFSLGAFVNQKVLFNQQLGNSHFVFGLGLTYHFSND